MKKKIIWLLVSCLMALSLVMASCGPVAEEEEEEEAVEEEEEAVEEEEEEEPGKEMVTLSLTKLDGTVIQKTVEKPRYGGTLYHTIETPTLGWDELYVHAYYAYRLALFQETLFTSDYTMGPAGTDEAYLYEYVAFEPFDWQKGLLAESWEMPEPGTYIIHIRPGIHWALDPTSEASRLVGGRELVAEDVAYSINRAHTVPSSYYISAAPGREPPLSIEATDRYTVVIKTVPVNGPALFEYYSHVIKMYAPEVIEKYGDTQDWRNVVGTGAWILTDELPGSAATYRRNPNYFEMDPFHPENRLPYPDGLIVLTLADKSTQLAALRTGKIDSLDQVEPEEADQLISSHPELMYYMKNPIGLAPNLFLRSDRPESPLYDVRVRQALNMAINRQEIVDDYYDGKALLYNWPLHPAFNYAHVPFDELPETARKMFEYHPDEARQLLAAAGYPDGFDTDTYCLANQVDQMAIYKDYWADIGVNLEIRVKEYGVYRSMGVGRGYDNMYTRTSTTAIGFVFYKLGYFETNNMNNYSVLNDPVIQEAYATFQANYYNDEVKWALTKELIPYIIEQSWMVPFPRVAVYIFWQPWLPRYYGERTLGYLLSITPFLKYQWIDTELKAALGH